MHNIKRYIEPSVLKTNKTKWTNELLDELKNKNNIYKDVDSSFKKHYKHVTVIDTLIKMNGGGSGFCYYCEQRVGKTDYPEIEHFKPKSIFPSLCFDWRNLHLSCTKCNKKKGIKWNSKNPMIDPCDDATDVSDHLEYSLWVIDPLTDNAITTIDALFLNDKKERSELIEARKKVFIAILEVIKKVNNASTEVEKRKTKEKLLKWQNEFEFRGMIEFYVKTFLK